MAPLGVILLWSALPRYKLYTLDWRLLETANGFIAVSNFSRLGHKIQMGVGLRHKLTQILWCSYIATLTPLFYFKRERERHGQWPILKLTAIITNLYTYLYLLLHYINLANLFRKFINFANKFLQTILFLVKFNHSFIFWLNICPIQKMYICLHFTLIWKRKYIEIA